MSLLQDNITGRTESAIERLVWSEHEPYIPRPLLSMHVRMGDKACEMTVVGFDKYMELAARLRRQFPSLRNIWLSTEMQASLNPPLGVNTMLVSAVALKLNSNVVEKCRKSSTELRSTPTGTSTSRM
jgi:hypothetical protein